MRIYWVKLGLFLFLFSLRVFAVEQTTYQAKIIKPDGNALEAASVNFKFTILNPVGACVLFSETYSAVNMLNSGGVISFALGAGTKTYPTSGTLTFAQVFSNVSSGLACEGGGASFTPTVSDNRKIVMQFNDGGGWQTLPAMSINAVPYAMYANSSVDSSKLNGKADTAFIQKASDIPTCDPDEMLYFNNATFSCVTLPSGGGGGGITSVTTSGTVLSTAGTASAPVIMIQAVTMSQDGYLTSSDYAEFKLKLSASSTQIVNTLGYAPVSGAAVATQIGSASLSGDVSGSISSNSVVSVGGKSASEVSTSVDATLSASASLVNNTIVKRDVSGNSSFNILSANQASVNYANIYKLDNSFSIRLQASSSLSANYTLTLPTTSGTVGQVLSTDGTGQLSWINPATGSITAINVVGPIQSTGGVTPTLSITQASSSTDGYLSSSDFISFTNKLNAASAGALATAQSTLSALTNNQILQVSGSTIVNRNIPSCGLNEYLTFNGTNWVCNTDSGSAGAIASINVTSPISSTGGSNPTLSIAQASLSVDGYLSSSDFTTFNNKQTATSAAIITTLGYTPADNAASGTYAQKVNNLSDLNNIPQARTNLGLGSFATANSIDLGSASATGIISDARLINSGVLPGTYTKITVDIKGRVTSSAALALSDVTTALGYTPAASGSFTSSQWVTSGTTINYANGFVGIGVNNPQSLLHLREPNDDWESSFRMDRSYDSDTDYMQMMYDYEGLKIRTLENNDGDTAHIIFKPRNIEALRIDDNGRVGIGTATPSAKLQIAEGTSSLAPLKFTSGTLLSSAQSGTMEYDGFNFYLTDANSVRRTIATGSAVGSIDNASEINSSGNITMMPTGSVIVSSTVASTNSQTGALIVKGGLGVAGDIYSSGTIITSSNIQGASITATSGISTNVIQGNTNLLLNPNVGNVGIGTTNPLAKLHVTEKGSAELTLARFVASTEDESDNQQLKITANAASNTVYLDSTGLSAGAIQFRRGGGDSMIIDSSGNVGIGTSTPVRRLEIYNNLAADTGIKVVNDGAGYATTLYSASSGSALTYIGQSANSVNWNSTGSGTSVFQSTGNIALATPLNTPRILIASATGNVGIGTLNPQQKLHIGDAGIFRIQDNDDVTAHGYVEFGVTTAGSWSRKGYIGMPGAANAELAIAADGVGTPIYLKNTTGTVMTVSGANVGIGTTSPQVALDVVGAIRVPGVGQMGPSGGFGYAVFQAGTNNFAGQMYGTVSGVQFTDNGGANTLFIKNGGNVGVGTTNPNAKLEINDGANTSLQIIPSGGVVELRTINKSGGYYSARSDATQHIWSVAGTEKVRIDTAGNLGIGTTSPVSTLDVSGTASVAKGGFFKGQIGNLTGSGTIVDAPGGSYARIQGYSYTGPNTLALALNPSGGNVGIGTASPNSKLSFGGYYINTGTPNSSEQTSHIRLYDDNASVLYGLGVSTNSLNIAANQNGGMIRFYTNSTEKVRIDTSGLVGIGTTNALAKLHVDEGDILVTGAAYPALYTLNTSKTPGTFGRTWSWMNYGNGLYLNGYASTAGNVAPGGPLNAMYIEDGTGYVGVGTSTPNAKLHVAAGEILLDNNYAFKAKAENGVAYDLALASTDGSVRYKGYHGTELIQGVNGATYIYTSGNNALAMTTLTNGNVGIGTSGPSEKLHVSGNARIQGTVTDCYIGNGSGGTSCSSDARLKENIKPIPYALEKINSLRGVEFDWNILSQSHGRHDIGVIAQDVEKVFPSAVITGDDGFKKVDYAVLIAPVIQAVKELYKLVINDKAVLTAKIEQLEHSNLTKDRKIQSLELENQLIKSRIDKIEKALTEK